MKGTIQLCKADVCLKADGDFAEVILSIIGVAIFIGVIAFIVSRLS